jgi:hypothetical protein
MKMLDKVVEQSDRTPNPNDKPQSCYCSALPKGSGLCLPCYMRWLAGRCAMAGFGGGSGAADGLNAGFVNADTSQ